MKKREKKSLNGMRMFLRSLENDRFGELEVTSVTSVTRLEVKDLHGYASEVKPVTDVTRIRCLCDCCTMGYIGEACTNCGETVTDPCEIAEFIDPNADAERKAVRSGGVAA